MLDVRGKSPEQVAGMLDYSTPEAAKASDAAITLAKGLAAIGLSGVRARIAELQQTADGIESDVEELELARRMASGT